MQTLVALASVSVLFATGAYQLNCGDLVSQHKTDSGLVDELKTMEKSEESGAQTPLKAYFDDCLDMLVRSNFFESVKYLIKYRFGDGSKFDKDSGRELSKAQAIV